MSWKDLIGPETVILPWLGGRALLSPASRKWTLATLPPSVGWHRFRLEGRKAHWEQQVDPEPEQLFGSQTGYLIGDRLVPDGSSCVGGLAALTQYAKVMLLPSGLDRFCRVRAGLSYPEGPLVYAETAWPLGPEDSVLQAWLDRADTVASIQHVTPALELAFRLETHVRAETDRRRQEAQERAAQEERIRLAREALGTAQGRRELARVDFEAAARAALQVGGAVYLDHRPANQPGEHIVRYSVDGIRLECVCLANLAIVDSGVCLTAEYAGSDGFAAGTRGDTFFTLESLPSVIREANSLDRLVIYRRG